MITVIQHEFGNTGSVARALDYLNIKFELTQDISKIANASKIILPGVGSYKAASEKLLTPEFVQTLQKKVLQDKTPIFGFCLGMQLLTEVGEEMGESPGLGLISGKTVKLRVDADKYRVPHMGWNDVKSNNLSMFKAVPEDSCFYFVHSYEVICNDAEVQQAKVHYGDIEICAALQKENIWGAQFHPEKSQKVGLQLLKNFSEL